MSVAVECMAGVCPDVPNHLILIGNDMRTVGTLFHFKTFDHSSVWDRRRAIISCLRLLNNFLGIYTGRFEAARLFFFFFKKTCILRNTVRNR